MKIKIPFEAILELETEAAFLRLWIRKLRRKYPRARLNKKVLDRLHMRAVTKVEYKYRLHLNEEQH